MLQVQSNLKHDQSAARTKKSGAMQKLTSGYFGTNLFRLSRMETTSRRFTALNEQLKPSYFEAEKKMSLWRQTFFMTNLLLFVLIIFYH